MSEKIKDLIQKIGVTQLDMPKTIVILGTALSGLAAFSSSYNALSSIDSTQEQCEQTAEYKQAMQTKFIVMMVFSCVALAIGIFLGFWLKSFGDSPNHKIMTYTIIAAGLFGIIYSITIRFAGFTDKFKIGISWGAFVAFIFIGFIMQREMNSAAATVSANLIDNS